MVKVAGAHELSCAHWVHTNALTMGTKMLQTFLSSNCVQIERNKISLNASASPSSLKVWDTILAKVVSKTSMSGLQSKAQRVLMLKTRPAWMSCCSQALLSRQAGHKIATSCYACGVWEPWRLGQCRFVRRPRAGIGQVHPICCLHRVDVL